jgi:hypothetical protein
MDGETDKDGKYIMRYTYPQSSWKAVMMYLIKKSGSTIPETIISLAIDKMIVSEYQSLKDVHQPIYFAPYQKEMRTETEPGDPNYGKLVPPNRDCSDRLALMGQALMTRTEKIDKPEQRWLDIGSNVGFFSFAFSPWYWVKGIEKDPEKVSFANMIKGRFGCNTVAFAEDTIDLQYVEAMEPRDIITALSILHLQLVEDKDPAAFWKLFNAIADKTKDILFFEFPPHSYGLLNVNNTEAFINMVRFNGKFKFVKQLGITDANRPLLACYKGDI